MPAPLGKALILDLYRVRPSPLEQPHGALDIQRIAVAIVRVDNQICIDAITDHGNRFNNFRDTDKSDVWPSQPRIRDRRAGYIERMKPGLRRDQGRERIVDA